MRFPFSPPHLPGDTPPDGGGGGRGGGGDLVVGTQGEGGGHYIEKAMHTLCSCIVCIIIILLQYKNILHMYSMFLCCVFIVIYSNSVKYVIDNFSTSTSSQSTAQ